MAGSSGTWSSIGLERVRLFHRLFHEITNKIRVFQTPLHLCSNELFVVYAIFCGHSLSTVNPTVQMRFHDVVSNQLPAVEAKEATDLQA